MDYSFGTFSIRVQLGCDRFGGFACGQQVDRNNRLNHSRRSATGLDSKNATIELSILHTKISQGWL